MILGLPWQSNYKIAYDWNRGGKHFISINHSINQHVIRQLAKTKGQCGIQNRSITWIMVKTPPNINSNSIHEIKFDRKLSPGLIMLDITHSLDHKHPSELLIPLLKFQVKKLKYLKTLF